ncbi:MAG: hypothetical protein ACOY3K_08860 [Candidatus Omnitrophota bacterium]
MRIRLWILAFLCLLSVSVVAVYLFVFFKVRDPAFIREAEAKVSKFLKAEVRIGKVQVRWLHEVLLSDLDIRPRSGKEDPYAAKIGQVIFRYDLIGLFKNRLQNPTALVLESPEISLPGEIFPYRIFEGMDFKAGGEKMAKLDIRDGYVHYDIPFATSYLELRNITGRFEPALDHAYKMQCRFMMSGILEGEARLWGTVNPKKKMHDLSLELHSVRFSKELPVPLKNLKGNLVWKNDNLYFEKLEASVYGRKIKFTGALLEFLGNPVLRLTWAFAEKRPQLRGILLADLAREILNGEVASKNGWHIPIRGKLFRDGLRYRLAPFRAGKIGRGHLDLDFDTGNYEIQVGNRQRQFRMSSNLRGLDCRFDVLLNHFRVAGLDLVSLFHIQIIPQSRSSEDDYWKFKGVMDTDYLILEYIPIEDLRGTFELTPMGIHHLLASWGRVFNLKAEVSFLGASPKILAELRVDGFDLDQVKTFANKPLPKKLDGLLEGKLKVTGPLKSPDCVGNFTIKSGTLGKLNYDLGRIQFRGIPPYLKLYDSYVRHGRSEFPVEGSIDFSRQNMFHGFRIRTPEKFILWKGIEANTSRADKDLEIDVPGLPTLSVSGGSVPADMQKGPGGDEDESEENYVAVGPKIRF